MSSTLFFFLAVMPLALLSLPYCQHYVFPGYCCASGFFGQTEFLVASEVNPTHSCMGFNTTSTNVPIMFGSWLFGSFNVRMVTGSSSGLCVENFGAPMVGFCAPDFGGASWSIDGCLCEPLRSNFTCTNHPLTESPAKPACSIKAPTENDYRIWSQEECRDYLKSLLDTDNF
mmetsp:Transcript_16946/g.23490  ORF Transcript_16946/g.23490 Transcript_16946/m.23490 type:complete len:172 (+) Transcript_16946:197-712(+)